MKKSTKTIVHDEELQIEACHFQGITQSFPNHFHEYHVIGCIEQGQRRLSCRNRDYTVGKGVILLFSPGDSHACTQKQGGALDYRSFHIPNKTMHHFIQKITGTTFSPHFSANVLYDRKIFRSFLTLHENIMKNSGEYGRREDFERFLSPLVRRCMLPDSSCGDREHREEVGKACRFMEQNYTARICLEDLCRCAGLSRTALTRAVRPRKRRNTLSLPGKYPHQRSRQTAAERCFTLGSGAADGFLRPESFHSLLQPFHRTLSGNLPRHVYRQNK